MSRHRARLLVEMGRETMVKCQSEEDHNEEITNYCNKGSPLPEGADFSEEYMASFRSAFEDPIESDPDFPEVVNNVFLGKEASCSPNIISEETQCRNSPMTTVPLSVEAPLQTFSPHFEVTPMPSPYSDFAHEFVETGENAIERSIRNNLQQITVCETPEPPNDSEDVIEPTPIQSLAYHNLPSNSTLTEIQDIPSVTPTCDMSVSTDEVFSPIQQRKGTKKLDLGRKRLRHVENWMDNQRKKLCNLGKTYTTRKGNTKEERKIKEGCINCRYKCSNSLDEITRSELFLKFWNCGDHVKQWEVISKYVKQIKKRSHTTEEPETSRRNFTLCYQLPIRTNDDSIILKKVCKKMFLNTFSISKDFVYTALKKYHESKDFETVSDNRGKHKSHKTLITSVMKQSVIDHVNSFVPVPAHYVRKRSSKKYLDSSLSIPRMFQMYPSWCKENNCNEQVLTCRQYRDIVNANINIAFYMPKKDQCDICHQNKNIKQPSDEQRELFEKHILEKELSRQLKSQNKHMAITNSQIVSAVFDFQKVLSAPHGNISVYYYKRKLNVYHLTIYDKASKEAYCYVWDEQTAKRGANEVASCMYNFLSKMAAKGKTEVLLWSDNCGGQNRNRIVYLMYMIAACEFNMKITHRFMEKGHTQNEGDSVHALIERSAKGKEIYSPSEWISLIRWAKVNGNPYNVIEVTQNMIYDFKSALPGKNWNKNMRNSKVSWNKIKEISVCPENKGFLYYKYSLGFTENEEIQCFKKASLRQRFEEPMPGKAYQSLLKIPKAKYNDLMYFCDKNIIPQSYHNFYRNLKFSDQALDSTSDEEE